MTKKKKSLLIATAIAMVIILAIGATLAYLTDQRTARNIVRIGVDGEGGRSIGIHLNEPDFLTQIKDRRDKITGTDAEKSKFAGTFITDGDSIATPGNEPVDADDTDLTTVDNTFRAEISNLMPHTGIYKDPTITNYGSSPAWIRYKLVNKTTGVDMTAEEITKLNTELGLTLNLDDFFLHTDGYYYYVDGSGDPKELAAETGSVRLFKTFAEQGVNIPEADPANERNEAKATMYIPAEWDYHEIAEVSDLLDFEVVAEALQGAPGHDGAFGWTDTIGGNITPSHITDSELEGLLGSK